MTVKIFRSTDFGAPVNANAIGSMIALLDSCLVTGYGSQTVAITSAAGIATVTTPIAHALKDGTFMRVAGATQTDYNGDFAITVTGANTYTYPVLNSPVSPATGTITSKVAPADWTKPFAGTGLAVFKQGAGSNGMYLRVDHSFVSGSSSEPKIRAYYTMTDVNTGEGATPETYMPCWYSTGTQPWTVVATEKAVFACIYSGAGGFLPTFFGDILSKKAGDTFNTLLIGNANYYNAGDFFTLINGNASTANHYLMRSHLQLGSPIACGKGSNQGSTAMGYGLFPYPSGIDGALHLAPVNIIEGAGIRGVIPGLWNPMHAQNSLTGGDIIVGTGDFVGKKFLVVTGGSNAYYQCLLEISNTW